MSDETKASGPSIAAEVIVHEFDYIAHCAFQNNEDRVRAAQLFFLTFGTLIAAVYSTRLGENVNLHVVFQAFAALCVLLALFGALTLLQLVRFRQAWMDSARAMDKIKDLVIEQSPELADYFLWQTGKLPPYYKPWSVGFLVAVSVALMSGVALGASVIFFCLARDPSGSALRWGWAATAGIGGAAVWFAGLYRWPLVRSDAGAAKPSGGS